MWYVWLLRCILHCDETSVFRTHNKLFVFHIVSVLILMFSGLVSFESYIWLPGTVLVDFAEINGFLLKRLIGRGIFCSICNVHRATAVIRRRQIDFNVSIVRRFNAFITPHICTLKSIPTGLLSIVLYSNIFVFRINFLILLTQVFDEVI